MYSTSGEHGTRFRVPMELTDNFAAHCSYCMQKNGEVL